MNRLFIQNNLFTIAYVLEKCGGTLLSDTCDDLISTIIDELEDSKKSDLGDYVREFAKIVESENAHKIFSIVRASISGMSTSDKKRKAAIENGKKPKRKKNL